MDAGTKGLIFVAVVVLIIVGLSLLAFKQSIDRPQDAYDRGCPPDVITCPDGSNLSRALPHCEFPPCGVGPSN